MQLKYYFNKTSLHCFTDTCTKQYVKQFLQAQLAYIGKWLSVAD